MSTYLQFDRESCSIKGKLDGVHLLPSAITAVRVQYIADGQEDELETKDFRRILCEQEERHLKLCLEECEKVPGLKVHICARIEEKEILWTIDVENQSSQYTVLEAEYPHLRFSGEHLNALIPKYGGILEPDVIERGYCEPVEKPHAYPCGFAYSMPWFAFYNKEIGLYAAIHDSKGALKEFYLNTDAEEKCCEWYASYPAENYGLAGNCFTLAGTMVWKAFHGDWYDAAMIYKAYVERYASWILQKQRRKFCETFHRIPVWIMNWLPNTPDDPDELPVSVRPDEPDPDPEGWYKRVIAIRERLQLPVGFHLYNWHKIPFNNDFPHYFPTKAGVREGIEKLHEHDIYVMPYINAKLWDTLDRGMEDFEFSALAKRWAARKPDGGVYTEQHASHEKNGELCTLAMMCPATEFWHETIASIVERLFTELKVDGVYLDQIAASMPRLCCASEHGHAPGGGSWWIEGYRRMLEKLNRIKPERGAFTTECDAEPFMDCMDGFLTWVWLHTNSVPAYAAIYSSRVTLFGRNTNGKKAQDTPFFKQQLAEAFVYGQQLGWISPTALNEERLTFLEKIARLRFRYTDLFLNGSMLRPPHVSCSLEEYETTPAMDFPQAYRITHIKAGGWRDTTGSSILFLINAASEKAEVLMQVKEEEYQGDQIELVEGSGSYVVDRKQGRLKFCVTIPADSYLVWKLETSEYKIKE